MLNRIFITLILLFFAMPFLFVVYAQFYGNSIGLGLQALLQTDPAMNVAFITSFVIPFIGFYMFNVKKQWDADVDVELVLMNLLSIGIAFLIMGNSTFALFVLILSYFIYFQEKVKIKQFFLYFKDYKKNSLEIKQFLAPLAVIGVSILIQYLTSLVA